MDINQLVKKRMFQRERMFQEGVKDRMIKAGMRIDFRKAIQPVWLDFAVSVTRVGTGCRGI